MVRRIVVGLLLALCCAGHPVSAAAQKVDPPKKIKNVDPIYPELAQRARIQGEVVIEATVGVDGKVSNPKVIGSVPQLDEAALAAVRQWEYAPAMADGTPIAVVMTVKVKFSLAEAPAPRPTGPLVLDRDGNDWTVRGTPLLDNNLRFWLREVMRTEPEKELFVHAQATATYADLVGVLASATAAGVGRLRLFVGDADISHAVRVWLDPVAMKPPGINLPVAEVGSSSKPPVVTVNVPRSGTVAAAKATVQRAPSGAVVRVRVDAARHLSEVWDVLTSGSARQVDGFALTVLLPTGAAVAANAPVSPQQQREWERVSDTIQKLVLSDKPLDESIAGTIPILEKFVARNPNVPDAQFKLASAYEYRAMQKAVPPETRHRDLESAVRHFELTAELYDNDDARFLSTWKIADLYGPENLNDAVLAQRYAQRLVAEHPTRATSHLLYAKMLHDSGDVAGAVNALRHGRTVSTMPMAGLLASMQYLVEQVQTQRKLPRVQAGQNLDEAIALADSILAQPEKQDSDVRVATMARVVALDLKAERVAQTSEDRLALLLESDRWYASLKDEKTSVPPPARKVSAVEAANLECDAFRRWSGTAATEQPISDAIVTVQQYATQRPACYAPHLQLGELFGRAAHDATDPKLRAAAFDRAMAELQQAVDLATAADDRNAAFNRLLELSGPTEANRPDRQEAAARAMLKHQPDDPAAHYTLAAILFTSGRAGDAEKTLRGARSAIKASPVTRAAMASELLDMIRRDSRLPPPAARRLFDEAGALLAEAENFKGGKDNRGVIETRMGWLNLSADRFETDPSRAAAQREQAKQLQARLNAIR